MLEDDAALGAGPVDGRAVEQDLAGVRLDQAGEQRHQRGLAGARVADDRDELALVDVEVDAAAARGVAPRRAA